MPDWWLLVSTNLATGLLMAFVHRLTVEKRLARVEVQLETLLKMMERQTDGK